MTLLMNMATTPKALHELYPRCRGLTLVEILVALLVLSIGLLGLAALQNTSLRFNTSAYYRTQATALSYDLADRMRANRQAALNGDYDGNYAPAACDPNALGAGTIAQQDIASWRYALACRIPQSFGSVAITADNDVTITVQWDDDRDDGVNNPFAFAMTTTL